MIEFINILGILRADRTALHQFLNTALLDFGDRFKMLHQRFCFRFADSLYTEQT